MRPWMKITREGVYIQVRVQPRAGRSEVVGINGDFLKVKVNASPVKGEANKELEKILGKFFGCGVSKVNLLRGLTGRNKSIFLEGMPPEEVIKIVDQLQNS